MWTVAGPYLERNNSGRHRRCLMKCTSLLISWIVSSWDSEGGGACIPCGKQRPVLRINLQWHLLCRTLSTCFIQMLVTILVGAFMSSMDHWWPSQGHTKPTPTTNYASRTSQAEHPHQKSFVIVQCGSSTFVPINTEFALSSRIIFISCSEGFTSQAELDSEYRQKACVRWTLTCVENGLELFTE